MKIKYVIISVAVVTTLGLGLFLWRNAHHDDSKHTDIKHMEDNHDEHAHMNEGEEGHEEEIVQLSDKEIQEFGIQLGSAKAGKLNQYIELPGEIVLNADGLAHVVPRVAGTVREVLATVGDRIEAGQLLAVLESRELANGKAAYLAAIEREKLAQANFFREERLWAKKVTSEQEYLDARQSLAEARIEKSSTEQQLHALGLNDSVLKDLPDHPDATYTRFEIRAPLGGTIIEKHMTLGENVSADTDVFSIADLSTVWVNLNIYQKDLVTIHKGQTVVIEIGHGIPSVEGKIAWVGPQIDEATRTAKARVELVNSAGNLRPGFFVTAKVAVGNDLLDIVVPKTALQSFEGNTVVFVRTDAGFVPKPVEIGGQNEASVEILSGLIEGQAYVTKGSFTLKAQLSKGAFGDGHNH